MSTIVNSEKPGESVEPKAEGSSFDRRHDLDALRAFAMLLGIGLHGSLAYITIPIWPVFDTQQSRWFDLFNTLVHGFRMPLFFMVSGFFTAMLWRKRGLAALVKHRAKRILLPLVIFSFTIIPALIGVIIILAMLGQLQLDRNPIEGPHAVAAKIDDVDSQKAGQVSELKTEEKDAQKNKPANYGRIGFAHLWFLWFLCLFLIPFICYALLADVVKWTGPPKFLFLSPAVLVWLIPLTMLPQSYHGLKFPSFGADTSPAILPPLHILSLYAVFFFFGVFYFDCDDKAGKLGRFWWLTLPVSILIIYPLGMVTVYAPQIEWLTRSFNANQIRLASVTLQVMYAWLMTFGLIGLFRTICKTENKTVRYISDSSYWLYVAHMPLIFLAQALVKPLNLPALVKFTIVCVSIIGVLLLSYDRCIRYTWLGTLLNGKRTRVKKLAVDEELVEPQPGVSGD